MLNKSWLAVLLVGWCVMSIPSGLASIVVNGTRVVYSGKDKEVTVKLTNVGKAPVLVQSWIDRGDVNANPEKIAVPFILTPPMNRIDPDKSQTLRLSYTASPALPDDRESIYWLNVLEIPSLRASAAPNRLQVAFRTRIKLIYRPVAIDDKGKANDAGEKLIWTMSSGKLEARNTSPYFISLVSVTLGKELTGETVEGEMIPPMGAQTFKFKNSNALRTGVQIFYQYINDWGAIRKVETTL